MDGTDATPRGIRTNNPCLIRNSGVDWVGGCAGADPDFVRFDTLENGIRAGARNFLTHWRRGAKSVRALIFQHAPPVSTAPADHNPSAEYAAFVAGCCGVDVDQAIDLEDLRTLERFVAAVIADECRHYPVAASTIRAGCARALGA